LSQKKQRARKKNKAPLPSIKPPHSAQAEADFYLAEEEQGTYDVLWESG
jgi:hypothetical protein